MLSFVICICSGLMVNESMTWANETDGIQQVAGDEEWKPRMREVICFL